MIRRRMSKRPVRKGYGKKKFIRKKRVGLRQPVQYFKRVEYNPGQIVVDATSDNVGAIVFSLAQVPSYTEFTSLYDQYKISAVKVKIVPRYNVSAFDNIQSAAATPYIPQVFTAIDYDDSGVSTVSDLLQYQNCKMTRGNVIHQRYLKPRCRNILQNLNGTASARAPFRGWIDSADPEVIHYGLKWAIPPFATGPIEQTTKFDVVVEYYLAMKNVR